MRRRQPTIEHEFMSKAPRRRAQAHGQQDHQHQSQAYGQGPDPAPDRTGGYNAECSTEKMTSQVMQVRQGRYEEAKG